jgi:catechol 2,3-dioxygenase-like lactoylglutathione lyase family enzyme
MLANTEAIVTIAVRDVARAARFYRDVLGLTATPDADESQSLSYLSGSTRIIVYRSEYAGTNKATAVTWTVGDEIGEIVAALKAKGVAFEHYELPGLRLSGDIHVGERAKLAWFKDPDGNILHIAGN